MDGVLCGSSLAETWGILPPAQFIFHLIAQLATNPNDTGSATPPTYYQSIPSLPTSRMERNALSGPPNQVHILSKCPLSSHIRSPEQLPPRDQVSLGLWLVASTRTSDALSKPDVEAAEDILERSSSFERSKHVLHSRVDALGASHPGIYRIVVRLMTRPPGERVPCSSSIDGDGNRNPNEGRQPKQLDGKALDHPHRFESATQSYIFSILYARCSWGCSQHGWLRPLRHYPMSLELDDLDITFVGLKFTCTPGLNVGDRCR
ncbi:hypothetical protein LXA43DRAFT_1029142 [Ganoderma leucocontextum]|nr:hypothetical protein LXA43DRAFT_1029142 [Ganoderma leucocontextum]